jgi:hypothetical protein
MKRSGLIALWSLVGTACSSTPTIIPTKNLDRPTDMTFVCLGMVPSESGDTEVLSGRPMSVCHPNDALDPAVELKGPRNLGTFAFITNAGRGELAVGDMDQGRLLDLSPGAPGYGMLPLGNSPEAVASTPDGCWVASANRAGCDLTLVDPSRLLARAFSKDGVAATPATDPGDAAHRLVVRTQSGRALATATGEMAFLPTPDASTCRADTADNPSGRPKAIMTFPSCDLVALVEMSFAESSAKIVSSYFVRPDLPGGFQEAGPEPVCPIDCIAADGSGSADLDAGNPDGATPVASVDAGGTLDGPRTSYYLQALALVPDGTRAYVGSLLDASVTSFSITTDAGAERLAHPMRFSLAENPLGVNRLRLAVDPYREVAVAHADGTVTKVHGSPLRDRGAFFLYAFTRDDSVRVVDIGGATPVECDVNVVAPPELMTQACIPVGTLPRKPLAQGPGIRIPSLTTPDSPPPLPRDIAFADLRPSADDTNYHALSGQFGFLLASNGEVYALGLAPMGEDGRTSIPNSSCATYLPNASVLPAAATNAFRDTRDVGQCARTPLTVSIAPQRTAPAADQAFATTANLSPNEGPFIASFLTDHWVDFPDPDTVVSPRWDITWEGALPRASRMSGVVRSGTGTTAGSVSDNGADFCSSGAQAGDILMFAGCNQNADCQPDNEFSCQVAVSGGRGMCLPIQASAGTPLMEKCAALYGSRLRYEILKATRGELTLGLKLDEVPKTTLNPCKVDQDCRPDAEHGLFASDSPDGGLSRAFECIAVRANDPRCVQRCEIDSDCRAGHVCAAVPGLTYQGKLCVEAPPISAECFPQPMTAYTVRAGHAFVVNGTLMPSLRISKASDASADAACVIDTSADPTLVNRIPLSAPRCLDSFLAKAKPSNSADELLDPIPVQQLSAERGSNPCLFQEGAGEPIRAFFQNPQIRFVMTNLDKYAGDLLGIHFELQYGFNPLEAQIPRYEDLLTMGTRILLGPTKTPESPLRLGKGSTSFPYLYVVDQGRTALTPGSRGQVLRINPRAGSTEIFTFDTALSGSTPFQLQ